MQDANYNVTSVATSAGTIQERYGYDPFGTPTMYDASWAVRTGGTAYGWDHLHQGLRWDPATGKYHVRNRDYDPAQGRWTTVDPLGFGAGVFNVYSFVSGSPVSALDPLGLEEILKSKITVVGGPSCMSCHGTGIVSGRARFEDLSPKQQMDIRRYTSRGGEAQSVRGDFNEAAFRQAAKDAGVSEQGLSAIFSAISATQVDKPPFIGEHQRCKDWVNAFEGNLRKEVGKFRGDPSTFIRGISYQGVQVFEVPYGAEGNTSGKIAGRGPLWAGKLGLSHALDVLTYSPDLSERELADHPMPALYMPDERWTDQQLGQDHTTYRIVFCGSKEAWYIDSGAISKIRANVGDISQIRGNYNINRERDIPRGWKPQQ